MQIKKHHMRGGSRWECRKVLNSPSSTDTPNLQLHEICKIKIFIFYFNNLKLRFSIFLVYEYGLRTTVVVAVLIIFVTKKIHIIESYITSRHIIVVEISKYRLYFLLLWKIDIVSIKAHVTVCSVSA